MNPSVPSTIEPIVPVTSTPLLHDLQSIYEPKFDGFRGVLYVSGRECYIRSKRGNVLRRFADLALQVGAELHARDAILDGEVVALDDEGRIDFRALLASRGWLHYAAFDLLWLNGKDLRAQPLIKRKRRLEQLIPANNSTLSRVLAVDEHGRELYEAVQRLDLEGIVAKRRVNPYSAKTIWYKVKTPPTPKRKAGGPIRAAASLRPPRRRSFGWRSPRGWYGVAIRDRETPRGQSI
jgi:bifunctional non-homologous end joining protein LigD